jgi:Fe-Mn family superoxide dismutase
MDNVYISALEIGDSFFKQFKNYFSEEQMKVHFNNHYLKYVSNVNTFIKENINIYKKTISELNNININLFDTPYISSERIKFIKLFSKKCKNKTLTNNINQLFFHELFFTGIATNEKSIKYFNTYMEEIFGNKNNFENFYKEYMDIGKKHFASGWLCFMFKNNKLTIMDTQDAVIPEGNMVACVDVWEHSYYIDYTWNKEEYLKKILLLLNWEKIKKSIDFYKK